MSIISSLRITICLLGALLFHADAHSDDVSALHDAQRSDLVSLIAEIDYLLDSAESLKRQYAKDSSNVRFNYGALIQQLRVTRDRSAEFLNRDLTELRTAPPETLNDSLIEK